MWCFLLKIEAKNDRNRGVCSAQELEIFATRVRKTRIDKNCSFRELTMFELLFRGNFDWISHSFTISCLIQTRKSDQLMTSRIRHESHWTTSHTNERQPSTRTRFDKLQFERLRIRFVSIETHQEWAFFCYITRFTLCVDLPRFRFVFRPKS